MFVDFILSTWSISCICIGLQISDKDALHENGETIECRGFFGLWWVVLLNDFNDTIALQLGLRFILRLVCLGFVLWLRLVYVLRFCKSIMIRSY